MNTNATLDKSKFHEFNYKAAFFCAICFMFFIPSSTALMNIFLFLTLIFSLLAGNIKKQITIIWDNPISKIGLLIFSFMLLGLTWSIENLTVSLDTLKKYNELWYIALLIPIFNSPQRREIGINVFLISMGIVLFGVYLMYFEIILPIEWTLKGRSHHFTVDGGFASHIITNILMAFAMFILAHRSVLTKSYKRWLYIVLFAFTFYYVLLISTGVTGQVMGIALLLLFIIQHFKKRALFFIPIMLASIILLTYNTENRMALQGYPFNEYENAIKYSVDKIQKRFDTTSRIYRTDPDIRTRIYLNALKTALEDPWIGTGIGSYSKALHLKQPDYYHTTNKKNNPHNEYLLFFVQFGLIGLLALVYLFYTQAVSTEKIKDTEQKNLAQGLVLLIVLGCMGNSTLMDSGEAHFWAFFSALFFSNLNKE